MSTQDCTLGAYAPPFVEHYHECLQNVGAGGPFGGDGACVIEAYKKVNRAADACRERGCAPEHYLGAFLGEVLPSQLAAGEWAVGEAGGKLMEPLVKEGAKQIARGAGDLYGQAKGLRLGRGMPPMERDFLRGAGGAIGRRQGQALAGKVAKAPGLAGAVQMGIEGVIGVANGVKKVRKLDRACRAPQQPPAALPSLKVPLPPIKPKQVPMPPQKPARFGEGAPADAPRAADFDVQPNLQNPLESEVAYSQIFAVQGIPLRVGVCGQPRRPEQIRLSLSIPLGITEIPLMDHSVKEIAKKVAHCVSKMGRTFGFGKKKRRRNRAAEEQLRRDLELKLRNDTCNAQLGQAIADLSEGYAVRISALLDEIDRELGEMQEAPLAVEQFNPRLAQRDMSDLVKQLKAYSECTYAQMVKLLEQV